MVGDRVRYILAHQRARHRDGGREGVGKGQGISTYIFPSTWTMSSVSAMVWPEIVAVA